MEPISAAIIAGGTLISGLMGARAQAEAQKRQSQLQAAQAGADNIKAAGQALSTGQQKAFSDLLAAFKGATS